MQVVTGARIISIHAPREGGDFTALSTNFVFLHFNPRPPRGGRRPTRSARSRFLPHFNPRPPRGGRRLRCLRDKLCKPLFQSTPPARGATSWRTIGNGELSHFNPRPPRGGRRWTETGGCTISGFQSTPPARGATGLDICALHAALISIHAPREGGDDVVVVDTIDLQISIHAPREGGDMPRG